MSFKSPYRMFSSWRAPREAALGFFPLIPYVQRVIDTGPIAYWVMNEAAGLVAVDQINSPGQDGAYTGVTLNAIVGPDGVNGAPFFDGANDFLDVLTVPLAAAVNVDLISVMIWAQVANVGVWTDGATRYAFRFESLGADRHQIWKHVVNNNIGWRRQDVAGAHTVQTAGHADLGWMQWVITATLAGNAMIAYKDGVQEGLPQVGLGAVIGVLNNMIIGAVSNVPANVFNGYLAHCAIWNRILTPAEVAALAVA